MADVIPYVFPFSEESNELLLLPEEDHIAPLKRSQGRRVDYRGFSDVELSLCGGGVDDDGSLDEDEEFSGLVSDGDEGDEEAFDEALSRTLSDGWIDGDEEPDKELPLLILSRYAIDDK